MPAKKPVLKFEVTLPESCHLSPADHRWWLLSRVQEAIENAAADDPMSAEIAARVRVKIIKEPASA